MDSRPDELELLDIGTHRIDRTVLVGALSDALAGVPGQVVTDGGVDSCLAQDVPHGVPDRSLPNDAIQSINGAHHAFELPQDVDRNVTYRPRSIVTRDPTSK